MRSCSQQQSPTAIEVFVLFFFFTLLFSLVRGFFRGEPCRFHHSCTCPKFSAFPELTIFARWDQYMPTPRKQVSSCLLALKLMYTFLLGRDRVSTLHSFSMENGLSKSRKPLLKPCQMSVSLRSLGGCLLGKTGVHVPVFPSDGLCF